MLYSREVLSSEHADAAADFYMSGYNVVFSLLPPLLIGIMDQDVDRDHALSYPGTLPSSHTASHETLLSVPLLGHPAHTACTMGPTRLQLAYTALHTLLTSSS